MKAVLTQVMVDLLAFLELSGDSIVDADAAVATMESVAADLQRLSREERALLVDEIVSIGEVTKDPRLREYVLDLPGSLGIL